MGIEFKAFCPVVNRPDLLEQVLLACERAGVRPTIIDNSEGSESIWKGIRYIPAMRWYRGEVPLSFSQSMNLEFKKTISSDAKFFLHMHSDALIPDGAIEHLLEKTREIDHSGRKWAVIYTFYDILAAYNPAAYQAIGPYDTTLPAYFSDNDWYHRCDLAGWERINTGIEVGHIGSQTINSDPFLKNLNGITFPLYRQYYIAKWGGEPGHELYPTPFNNFSQNRILIGSRKG